MSQPAFRTVLRGYEPSQVDQRTAELVAELRARREEVARLAQEADELRRALHQVQERGPGLTGEPVTVAEQPGGAITSASVFAQLGGRIQQILTLAEEEADDLLGRAQEEARAVRSEAHTAARARQLEAERYDATVRSDAEVEAQRITAEAERRAEELVDAAHRDAAARRQEAEALWESHRAKAAQAARDFEITLAGRRDRAEEDFRARSAAAQHQLASVERAAAHAHQQSERQVAEAASRVRAMLADASTQAQRLVGEARERAQRMRADSDRELAAASNRRDSINAQLTNVRQMLATLSGSVPVIGFEVQQVEAQQAALREAGEPEVVEEAVEQPAAVEAGTEGVAEDDVAAGAGEPVADGGAAPDEGSGALAATAEIDLTHDEAVVGPEEAERQRALAAEATEAMAIRARTGSRTF